jgi:hypothetical protein
MAYIGKFLERVTTEAADEGKNIKIKQGIKKIMEFFSKEIKSNTNLNPAIAPIFNTITSLMGGSDDA